LQGVRLKSSQWDKFKRKVVNHPQADTINSVALSTLAKASEAVMQLGSVRGWSTAKVRDKIAEYIYPSEDVDTGFIAVMQSYTNQCDKPNTKDKFVQTATHIKRWLGSKGARSLQFADITPEEFLTAINVNVTSALLLSQKVAPIMKAKGGCHIINVASIVGWAAHWGFVGYVTSKHAMVGLTKAMANELAPEIHVNGICPGAIRTAMLDSVGGEDAFGPMIQRTALKRVGEGSEIASVALFLATEDSSFMDGQLLRVDGGVDV
jgi:hypothetical protein